MKAIQYFSDKSHAFAAREVFPTRPNPVLPPLEEGVERVTDFLGFGVAITPSSCYVLSQMEPTERKALLRHIYTEEGLNLSIGRLCIGASDYSPEIYSYDDVPFDTALSHFSIARDEAYVIPMLKEILAVRPDLYLFAAPWSPPFWMKTGESMCGGYMREEFLGCYAEYFIRFLRAYEAHGIHISAVTPQNEVNTQQMGLMPSCIWHPEIEASFVKILRQRLTEEGLSTKIWLCDHSFRDAPRVLWQLQHCEGLAEAANGVAFHYYDGSIEESACLRQGYPSHSLHFTEAGPRLTDHYGDDHCKWGLMIARAFKMGYQSFCGWNLLLDELGGPNVGLYSGVCGGLVTRDSRDGVLSYSGQHTALRHIAPFVTKETKVSYLRSADAYGKGMYTYPSSERKPLEGVKILGESGKTVAVVVNPNPFPLQSHIILGGERFYLDLPGESISSIVKQ